LGLEILDLDAATHSAIVQAAFDASPIGVAVVDARGLIRAVNPALAQLTGYTRAELTGAPIERLVPDAQRSVHVAARNAYRHAPTSRPMGAQTEIHARHKSGQTLPVEVGLQTCTVGGAQLTVAVVNDLSTRKYAEAEARLRASNAQLEAVRRALIRFLGRSDMHACMDGLLGELLSLTDSAYGFIGEIRRDEGGHQILQIHALAGIAEHPHAPATQSSPQATDLVFHDPDNLFGWAMRTGDVVLSNDPVNDPRSKGLPPGHPPLSAFLGMPFRDGEELIGMVGIANRPGGYDIELAETLRPFLATCASMIQAYRIDTERRRAERALALARERAEAANRAKTEFLANMSHELRTPLVSVMGFTDRLMRTIAAGDTERNRDALGTIERNARQLLGMISDILDLSKIDAGHLDLRWDTFDAVEAIRDAVTRTATLADDRPVTVTFDPPAAPVTVTADRTKLQQITTNLVSNAIKCTAEGWVRIELHAAIFTDQPLGLRLTVSDSGCGIRQEDCARIFERFTQLDGKSTRRVGGAGLGLAITRELVEAHGGTISVDSVWGEGSTFAVTIPSIPAGPHRDLPGEHVGRRSGGIRSC
jgi:PAS domain S-box-containing protein